MQFIGIASIIIVVIVWWFLRPKGVTGNQMSPAQTVTKSSLPLMSKIMLVVAVVFVIVGSGIWWVFLRTVPVLQASGIIVGKIHKPSGEYLQYPVGIGRTSFLSPTAIPTAEAYVFGIQVDGWEKGVYSSLGAGASAEFNINDKVTFNYQERGLPLVWKRVYVLDMHKAQ